MPNDPYPLHIDKRSQSLKVIQHIRNEAHRFAITFHRNVRSKKAFRSELEDIPGIGPKTADKLLRHFKSIVKIKEASQKNLLEVVSLRLAKAIRHYWKEERL